MQLRIAARGVVTPIAVTMRTPGDDFTLAAGLAYTEGLLGCAAEIARIDYCTDVDEQLFNAVTVTVTGDAPPPQPAVRRGAMVSACGVCGKTSLEDVRARGLQPLPSGPGVERDLLYSLPEQLRAQQATFNSTGGLHAAGLFQLDGTAVAVSEDVGRHNAVDKVIGRALLDGRLPARDLVLMVSGRAGFEIVQKALAAGIPVVAAVSAPSSLAVGLAREFNQTLVGFLRGRSANVYAGAERIVGVVDPTTTPPSAGGRWTVIDVRASASAR